MRDASARIDAHFPNCNVLNIPLLPTSPGA